MRKFAYLLSLALIFCIPWENAISVAGLGTLARLIGMATATAWLGSILVIGKFRKPHPFHLLVFLFILWNVMSFFWSVDMDETQMRVITYVQLGILSWMLWDLYTTPKALRSALQAYIMGAFIAIGGTFYNFVSSQAIGLYSGSRFSGVGMNANDLALILILGLPVAWYLMNTNDQDQKIGIRWFVNFAYILSAVFAILLTASRTAIFAILPAIVYIFVAAHQTRLRARTIILIILIGALFVSQNNILQSFIDRLSTISTSIVTRDLGGRLALWNEAIKVFSAHPLLGTGSATLQGLIGGAAHNTFLSILAELGIIGFVFFLLILAIIVYQAIHQPKRYSTLWLTTLLIWAVGVSTLTWEFRKPTWLFMSLIVTSASLFAKTKASALPLSILQRSRPHHLSFGRNR